MAQDNASGSVRPIVDEPGFRALVCYSQDALVLIDRSGEILFASPSLGSMVGLSNLEGRIFSDLILADDQERYAAEISELRDNPGGNRRFELQCHSASGGAVCLEVVATNLLTEPTIGAFVLNVRDVSERRQAEAARLRSESRFRRLAEANIIGIAFWRRAGEIYEANDAFLRTVGYERQDLEGGHIRWTDLTPREYVALDAGKLNELERTGVATVYEKELIRKDGLRVPVLVGAAGLDDRGDDGIAYFLDLTQQKRTEAALDESRRRMSLLVEALPDYAVLMLDSHGVILTWNRGAQNLFGYAAADIIGRNFAELFAPEARENVVPQAILDTAARKGCSECEEWGIGCDGRQIFFSGSVAALRHGQPNGFIQIIRDATDRRRAEELNSAIFASVSHDLLTPLSGMLGSVQNLRGEGERAWTYRDAQERLAELEADLRQFNALVRNLLELARLEGGAWHPKREWYDLIDLVGAGLRRLGAGRDQRVDVQLPDSARMVFVDAVQLVQVIWNLLDNALKYSPANAAVVFHASVAEHELRIEVRDEGPGVAASDRQSIFRRYYRAPARTDDDRSPRTEGTGLGLAICRAIVEAHGGRVWVEGNASGGATFCVVIPGA